MASSDTKKTTLVAIFASVATAIVTGFASELVTFPFFHDSTLGGMAVEFSGAVLLPIYEGFGEMLGIPSQLAGDPNLPTFA